MKPNKPVPASPAQKIGIRKAMQLARDHASGILESTDDGSFWGEDFFYDNEPSWDILTKAKKAIIKRIDQ